MFGTPIHANAKKMKKGMSNLCKEGSIKHKMVVQQPLSGLHTERGRKAQERTSLTMEENGPSLLDNQGQIFTLNPADNLI
jgi:hypothetical protein